MKLKFKTKIAIIGKLPPVIAGNPLLGNPFLLLPVLAIVVGEFLIFYSRPLSGLAIHIFNLQVVALVVIFGRISELEKNVLQSLILLLLLRLVNLSLPQFFTLTLLWYPLIYGVMFLPVYQVIHHQNITLEELGVTSRRLWVYIPLGLVLGGIYSLLEYFIIHPQPLILVLTPSNLALVTLVMTFFVSLVEELIFRSILLTRLEQLLGTPGAILVSGLLFAVMHSGYRLYLEIFYALLAGLLLGYSFHRTRSLPMVVTLHATTNILLFGVLPFKF